MKKIEFKKIDDGFRTVHPNDPKFILLSLFIGKYRFPKNIQQIIDLLESVNDNSKTWEEAIEPYSDDTLDIGYGSGELDIQENTAYFFSKNDEESFDMPLQELIDVMKEWKGFMS
ncbi:hypothetical protein [Chryseobacterium taiwanense]|uniref:Uncharacterized protein n=1 Tax=Chryseobacterium taiwanense TaxID=363331 RepID=A0A0B4D4P7_9FLAO|nr:hypothetical protein [Chryseobacterium taiwanense]KIC61646.1 hypothetical protein RM51_14680 [Chryseobacterium taiwanense]